LDIFCHLIVTSSAVEGVAKKMLLVVMNAVLFLLYGNLAPDNSGVPAPEPYACQRITSPKREVLF
jgi:hypothetical protein